MLFFFGYLVMSAVTPGSWVVSWVLEVVVVNLRGRTGKSDASSAHFGGKLHLWSSNQMLPEVVQKCH
jgi:hypothetical protein